MINVEYPTDDLSFLIELIQSSDSVQETIIKGKTQAYILKGTSPLAKRMVLIRDINGQIDFIFAKTPITTKPNTPIFCVTESKIGRVIEAFPQAIAQMLGVREFNKSHDKDIVTIHAIVTDGKTWRILKLLNQNALVDQTDYSTDNLPILLGVFQEIIDFYKK